MGARRRAGRTPAAGRSAAALLVATFVVAGCGGDATAEGDADAGGMVAEVEAPEGAVEATLLSLDGLADEVEAAIADAAAHYGVPEAEVAVAGALDVVWADGSLGCPEEGVLYPQVLTDGYLLTLEVEGRRVTYHGADDGPPLRCDR